MTTGERDRSPRWSELLGLLAERGRLGVGEVSEALGVSPATVRRDFNDLAAQQLATRTHGGVVATAVAYDLPARYRSDPDSPRARVARAAALRLPLGGVVGFNGGTTTTATVRELLARPGVADASAGTTTVVTNALNIATELVLRPGVRCVTLGGVARAESYELTGSVAVDVMEQLWLEDLVLGVGGFDPRSGATCRHDDEAGVNAAMVRRADRVHVVATGDKVGRTVFARICGVERVTTLVTDTSAPAEVLDDLRERGVEVVQVE